MWPDREPVPKALGTTWTVDSMDPAGVDEYLGLTVQSRRQWEEGQKPLTVSYR